MKKETKDKIRRYGFMVGNTIILIVLLDTIGIGKGILVYVLFLLIMMGIRAYYARENVKQVIRYIEIILFNKPLEREFWKKGEKIKMNRMVLKK